MNRFIKEWGVFLLIASLIILSRFFLWDPVTVDGHSMDPTLQDGERLIMLKTTSIERFDIVVASETDEANQEKWIVKRVIGMPGDTIRYEDDTLYVNEEEVKEPYLADYLAAFQKDKLQATYAYNNYFQQLANEAAAFTIDSNKVADFTVVVPEGQYYLLGDDRLVSKDSRHVGTFDRAAIKGEVLFRFWPLNRLGTP